MSNNERKIVAFVDDNGEVIPVANEDAVRREILEQEREIQNRRKAERQNGFRTFYQVNRKYSYVFDMLLQQNQAAMRMLGFIIEHMEKNNTLFATASTVATGLEVSESTVSRCKKCLVKMGIIEVQKYGGANVYIVNPELIWGDWSKYRKDCPFTGIIPLPKAPKKLIRKDPKTKLWRTIKKKKTQ